MKIIWDRQKTCQGQTETVHGTVRGTRYTVSFYNVQQYLRYHLIKSKCLHLAQLKLQYESCVKCFLENNRINLGLRKNANLPLP